MLRPLARAARVRADRRIHDEDFDVGIGDMVAIEKPPRKIDDADAVGLTDRRERAFPNAHRPKLTEQPELRAFGPQ